MIRTLLVLLVCACGAGAALAGDGDLFHSPTVGFEVTKPEAWLFLTVEENLENLKRLDLEDEEFQKLMEKYATAPLVVMTKYPEPFDDINPSFKVNIRPFGQLKDRDGKAVLALALPQFRNLFADFVLVQEPMDTTVSGMKAAYMRIDYSLQAPDGRTFPTTSELWVVPRGDYFFMIGAGLRQDEATGTRSEIQAILDTVKIEP